MSVYILLFFLLRFSAAKDDCTPTRCSHHGPTIRFPFRLKNHHPPHCGYPGFDLSCSPNTTSATTILHLPVSVKVLVNDIDYKSQLIHIKDPNSCFPQQLRNLNLSAAPFIAPFPQDLPNPNLSGSFVGNFSVFSCPSTPPDWERISERVTCLSGHGREVYAVNHMWDTYEAPMMRCRKMYNVWSVPYEAFYQTADLQLRWPLAVCRGCEAEGKFCRLSQLARALWVVIGLESSDEVDSC
ncbi:hypothetical protein RHGRI_008679 [Rhododendron griersonianum]|uniref:RING-type E3 ubiquitin transferase n=1 Tax=Rhododendron griersonianum TaxID=479676 RepID=A0AAV6L2D5_9ERIC|nr:hypothetical protein RHGRI_008679 [Rhododendron griersonianum]